MIKTVKQVEEVYDTLLLREDLLPLFLGVTEAMDSDIERSLKGVR